MSRERRKKRGGRREGGREGGREREGRRVGVPATDEPTPFPCLTATGG